MMKVGRMKNNLEYRKNPQQNKTRPGIVLIFFLKLNGFVYRDELKNQRNFKFKRSMYIRLFYQSHHCEAKSFRRLIYHLWE